MEFLDKAKNLLSDAKVYWRTPLKGDICLSRR